MEESFEDRLTNLIGECYGRIGNLCIEYCNLEQETKESEELCFSLLLPKLDFKICFFPEGSGREEITQDYIVAIYYYGNGMEGNITIETENSGAIDIEQCLDSDVCELTDYLIKQYEQ